MKILLSSYTFDPQVGGIESVSATLASEFVRLGHEVKIVTMTPSTVQSTIAFEVIRRPTPRRLLCLLRWSDVYLQNHISLHLGWPLIFIRKPWVAAQHTWLMPPERRLALRGGLKRLFLRSASCVAVSRAIATELPRDTRIIGNPYDDSVFRLMPEVKREDQLIFVGRLIHGKGVHLLVEAISLLKSRGLECRLTVVGTGGEEQHLRRLAEQLEIDNQVIFTGTKTGHDLATLLNRHRILLVPSTWQEPFGIVALEGAACGCIVIGSEVGGLPDAIGPCGVTFPNGDLNSLADRIGELCVDPVTPSAPSAAALAHLAAHSPVAVADEYLRLFKEAVEARHRK
jgi:glycogen synthase